MEITKTFNWNRRDFSYDLKCEHCGFEQKDCRGGYDDSNYYNNVVPAKVCPNCKESSNSKKNDSIPKKEIIPKYERHTII